MLQKLQVATSDAGEYNGTVHISCFMHKAEDIVPLLSGKCVLTDIKSDVYVFFCPGTHISAAMTPFGVNFCLMVELCLGRVFCPFAGDIFMGRQMRVQKRGFPYRVGLSDIVLSQLTANISKRVSRSQGLTPAQRELSKNVWHKAVDPRDVPHNLGQQMACSRRDAARCFFCQ